MAVVVCVTGAGGFIGSWIVKLLLARGYTVRGTSRRADDPKNAHLWALDGAAERLTMVQVDLLDRASLRAAFDGCVGVIHTASPMHDNPEEIIEPIITWSRNVVEVETPASGAWSCPPPSAPCTWTPTTTPTRPSTSPAGATSTTARKPRCKDEAISSKKGYKFTNQPLKDLGMKFTPVHEYLYEAVKSLQEKGFIQKFSDTKVPDRWYSVPQESTEPIFMSKL